MTNHFRLERKEKKKKWALKKSDKTQLKLALNVSNNLRTLISTWLNVFPLYTPTMLPTISGTMIMFLKWVFTTSGFSFGGASFLAFRSFFTKAIGFLFNPLENRLLALACMSSISISLKIKTKLWGYTAVELDGNVYKHKNKSNQLTLAYQEAGLGPPHGM